MLKRNIIANFLGQGWTALMGLAFVPLYIKYLGVEAYGLIGFYAILQSCLTVLDVGITQTLNREMARFTAGAHTPQSIKNLLRSLELIAVVLALLIFFFVWIAASYISTHWLSSHKLTSQEISSAVTMMGIVISVRFVEGLYKGALFGLQKQVAVNIISAIFATSRYAGVIGVLAFYDATIKIFFIWQTFSSVISVLVLIYLTYCSLPTAPNPATFSKQAVIEVWRFASGMLGITVLSLLLTQVDKIILSKLISLESYGYYTLAATAAGSLTLVVPPICQAILPKMVQYVSQNRVSELIDLFHKGSQFISALIAPLAIMFIFFGKEILYLWTGNIDLAIKTYLILQPLTIGCYLNSLLWMPYQLQLAFGWTNFMLKINVIAVGFIVPSIYLITPKFGAIGAAWVWVLLNVGYMTFGMSYMFRRLLATEMRRWYLEDVIKQLATSIFVVCIAKFVLNNFKYNYIEEILLFGFILILAFICSCLQSSFIKSFLKSIFPIFSKRK